LRAKGGADRDLRNVGLVEHDAQGRGFRAARTAEVRGKIEFLARVQVEDAVTAAPGPLPPPSALRREPNRAVTHAVLRPRVLHVRPDVPYGGPVRTAPAVTEPR